MSAARHLAVAPTEAEILADEIRAVCHQIDRRHGNAPGTAEKGLYLWLWPPDPLPDVGVLIRLHSDALMYLYALTNIEKETP